MIRLHAVEREFRRPQDTSEDRDAETYTFYLRGGAEPSRFEPGMYAADPQATAHARELLRANPERESVDVFFGNDLIVCVTSRPC